MSRLTQYLPVTGWARGYQRQHFIQDLTAAVIVTVLLIPQSLAYALLAGVPPEVGLYASILPLVGYALFGTSRTLSVGPVAVISLMTATTLGSVTSQGTESYLTAAAALALLSGLFLVTMGLLKLGFVTNFLSHSVISGFITASGIIIAFSQLKHILGIRGEGDTLTEILPSLLASLPNLHLPTLAIGAFVVLFLILARSHAAKVLGAVGLSPHNASLLAKTAPIFGVLFSIGIAYGLGLEDRGVQLTGDIPAGLPALSLTWPSWSLIQNLALPALLISIIGYVESISVGKTLGSKRRQKVDADQELLALGAANIASSVSGGFPVTGGFSRSVVNFDAGAVTQAASVMTAVGIALASLLLTPVLYYLPKATLAATIVVAVISLVDFSILKRTWRFSRSDFYAVAATIALTLIFGVEVGVACGVAVSIGLHLYRTSRPHVAEVGLIEGTEHFRNVKRFDVRTVPEVLTLRPDESLFFANSSYLEDTIREAVSERKRIAHVVLLCSAVNEIDFSALEMLETLNEELAEQDIRLHLSEVKGPVMDKLKCTGFLDHLSGRVFVSQYEAFTTLSREAQRS
ncbi:SulP family inorganic anion transporter [Gilvimarinus sp. F26214L]|uniref:SulP family inorganic anion transporter n=1 Tax=Gilvimarinus sp. DZF01 TaxID=3461371 RepID=UPI0040454483